MVIQNISHPYLILQIAEEMVNREGGGEGEEEEGKENRGKGRIEAVL
jgi:hypothetical protein